jgi:hypothetical protein
MPAALLDHLVKNAYTREVLVRHSLRHNDSTAGLSGLPKLPLAGYLFQCSHRVVWIRSSISITLWEGETDAPENTVASVEPK